MAGPLSPVTTVRPVHAVPAFLFNLVWFLVAEVGPWPSQSSFLPGDLGPNPAAAGQGRRRGAGPGPGAPGDAPQPPEAQLNGRRLALPSVIYLSSWGRVSVCPQTVSCCVSSVTGEMKCWHLWGLGRQNFPNSF